MDQAPASISVSADASAKGAAGSDSTAKQVTVLAKGAGSLKRSASAQKLCSVETTRHDVESADPVRDHLPDQLQVLPTPVKPQSALAYVQSGRWARPLVAVAALYLVLILMLVAMVRRLPTRGALSEKAQLPADTLLLLKLPRNVVELRAVRHTLELYRENYGAQVAVLLATTYLVMQSLAIPGSVGINLLMGSMYSFPVAFATIALISTVGACLNYAMSMYLVKDIVLGLFHQRVSWFSRQIAKQRDHLLPYFVFLRISPLLPSWFINLASPIVSIPFSTFALGSFIGLQPLNFISVSAGRTLGRMKSISDLYSPRTLLTMMACALLALLPAALKQLAGRHPRLRGGGLRPLRTTSPIP